MKKETLEQQAVIQWSKIYQGGWINERLISIPNGGSRNKIEAVRLKKEGVKAGVSDLFFAHPTNEFCGLWIEMKTNEKSSRLSKAQAEWLKKMNDAGYRAEMCRGAESTIKAIMDYISYDKADSDAA